MTAIVVQTFAPTPGANVYLSTAGALARIDERFKTTVVEVPMLPTDALQDELWIAATLRVELESYEFLTGSSPVSDVRAEQTLLFPRSDAVDYQGKIITDPEFVLQSWSDGCIHYWEELAAEYNSGVNALEPKDHEGVVEIEIGPEQADLRERYAANGQPGDWFRGRYVIESFLKESFPPGTCS